ncbi:Uncharacterized protein OBRU01_15656 [Operophtera brumata]|uniref:Uncharacterized protein n=1 Tax=Operophtera brumata TaxID=104452 RepID=A0A0L7L413_OPEBR|nr:Uncharacterized protein OBRU01_15656 [Operophtera brumata]
MMANSNQLEAELAKLLAMRSARDAVLADMDRALLLLQASKFQDTKVVLRDIKKNVKKILDLWNVEAVEEALSKIGWNKKRLDDEAQAQLAVAPVGAAGASSPEGAAGADSALGSSTAPDGASALAGAWETDTFIASAATESAIEAVLFAPDGTSAVKSAMAVLTGLVDPGTPAEPFASSSSSSMETTPTAHLANALSASVPDMQNNTGSELQFHSDYFKSERDDNSLKSDRSERSDRSVNSGASGQSDRSGKSSRSGKGSAGNDGGERSERSWNHSFRSARGAAAAPSFERHGSLRSDFKSSASLEQVSYKSLVNNKKADKKKVQIKVVNSIKPYSKFAVNLLSPQPTPLFPLFPHVPLPLPILVIIFLLPHTPWLFVRATTCGLCSQGKRSRRERDKTPPRAEIDPSVRRYNYQFFKDITTAIEEMFLNVVLSLNDMIDKGKHKSVL